MNEQWCSGAAECLQCGREWVAVWPLGAESLECPSCGSTDTVADAILAQKSQPYVGDEASKGEYAAQCMPPLPEAKTLGSSRYGSIFKGYEAGDMHAHARAYAAEQVRELLQKLLEIVDVYDDGQRPYDERAYVGGTFAMCIEEARALIAKHKGQA